MHIGIDATPVLLRSAGVKNYLYHWIQNLQAIAGSDTVRAFPFIHSLGSLDHERSVLSPAATYFRLGLLYLANKDFLPALDWMTAQFDVFHMSNQIRHPPSKVRITATVHDMTCWLSPEMHTEANVRADRTFADRVLRRAAGLITVSESTKRDLLRILDLDERKVHTIYPGVPEQFFNIAQQAPAAKPYILYVGTIEPRKNIDVLLDAYEALPQSIRDGIDLVIAGPMGWASRETAARLHNGAKGVDYRGYVAENELPRLFSAATLFAYPSLYEGFGFPVAQAMAAGVPVLTSAVSSLPEVTGGHAVLVDPQSCSDVRNGLLRALEDGGLRSELAAKGRERASLFRWENTAKESLRFFSEVAGQ